MLVARLLSFSHLDCKANPTVETGVILFGVSVLRTETLQQVVAMTMHISAFS